MTWICALLGLALAAVVLGGCASMTRREKKRDDASNYNMQLGVAYLNQGELQLAKDKLERAESENPNDPNVHSAMAMLQDRLGHPDKADKEFRAALSLGTPSPAILNNYAVYLCRNGRVDEGVKSFEEAAHNPLYRTPEAAYTNAGVCLRGAKRDTQAAMSFMRALQVKPNFAEAAYQLADLDFQQGELREARETVERYMGSFEATPDLLLLAVRICRRQGDRVAEEKFARKLRLDFPASDQARALSDPSRNPG